MVRKPILVLLILLVLTALIYGIYTYTQANIKTETDIRINNSTGALISTPENPAFQVKQAQQDKEDEIIITNNMADDIWINATFNNIGSDMSILSDNIQMASGETKALKVRFSADSDAAMGTRTIDAVYHVTWDGGSATINNTISVEVIAVNGGV